MSPASSSPGSVAGSTVHPQPHVVEDCRGQLQVLSDGSIIRSPELPAADADGPADVEWKDVIFDAVNGLSLRLYRPRRRHPQSKLPIVYYFHGGGFCIGSRITPWYHRSCSRLSDDLHAVVVTPDYRLAPEHRLPAAINDGVSSLLWLQNQASSGEDADPWLSESAEFKSVFVSGESAGGNIAHHLAVSFAGTAAAELSPVQIKGYVLIMPFFGGKNRTVSEASCPENAFLNLDLNDRYWRLALPEGADIDDSVANPFGPAPPPLETAELAPLLVVVGEKDLLRDREVEYVERLKGWGKSVELVEIEGQEHGYFALNAGYGGADDVVRAIRGFMEKNGSRI